ncbi:toll/interleukin-1 receptor domain-containing protein [Herbaspirillum frisingense]|uniref:toll/interleukin-1 receptor domain-containing protein n=1 Tax=Herbaspirillum frisingense TaxID=92645 RepID=UPI001F2C2B61|nr:toll/interleukin-1 receptor domain-containing protein [Herbaspirillum frisingense]UIN21194.1 toll/interleukin-1 receptor domain-containing protein [Herbaspirillum frisingense]
MSRCTAPVRGHSSAAAAAQCPACRHRSRYCYGGYSPSYSSPSNYGSGYSSSSSSGGGGGGGKTQSSAKPRWSKSSSSLSYTTSQVVSLTPVREAIEKLAAKEPDLRDVFLCHAWDDRQGAAQELHSLLVAAGVKVWFSEKDLGLGVPMMRAIDKGLANSRIGLVLVTPALLLRLPKEGVADKELSVLLARNQLVPIVHNTSYEALRNVSPMLASRSGLDTSEESMEVVAKKIAELVAVQADLPGMES